MNVFLYEKSSNIKPNKLCNEKNQNQLRNQFLVHCKKIELVVFLKSVFPFCGFYPAVGWLVKLAFLFQLADYGYCLVFVNAFRNRNFQDLVNWGLAFSLLCPFIDNAHDFFDECGFGLRLA